MEEAVKLIKVKDALEANLEMIIIETEQHPHIPDGA